MTGVIRLEDIRAVYLFRTSLWNGTLHTAKELKEGFELVSLNESAATFGHFFRGSGPQGRPENCPVTTILVASGPGFMAITARWV
jgi:hypothetical protein